MHDRPAEIRPSEAERIAFAYRMAARGDAWLALVRAVEDALADLDRADRRVERQAALISRGYVRGGPDGAHR
ncbi:hypothetical protein [Methylobacterium oxalidis]|uniref:hypothetical protein n=1 Tax=Methylobacterium oxalidis TaxID=944322 RepID=UPI003314B560